MEVSGQVSWSARAKGRANSAHARLEREGIVKDGLLIIKSFKQNPLLGKEVRLYSITDLVEQL